MNALIVIVGILSLATLVAMVAPQKEQIGAQRVEAQNVDDELMVLAAQQQGSPLPASVIALMLSVFAILGAAVFRSDVHELLEEQDSKEDSQSEALPADAEPKPQSETLPALWPCTPLHVRGLMHGVIVIVGVLSLATMVSMVAPQKGQMRAQTVVAQNVDDELTALAARQQGSPLPASVIALMLSVFTILGAAVFR